MDSFGYLQSLTCGLTNTLWERGAAQFGDPATSNSVTVHVRNNLFRNFNCHFIDGKASWTVNDNLVDTSGLDDHGTPLTNAHNAYYAAITNLSGGTSNLTLTNLDYVAGPLADYYQPTNSNLINAGSTTADLVGLYHFTTTTNQVKETNSVVDIGPHWVALNANGELFDYDGDSVPDYYEDFNGNGSYDSGELNWQNKHTDGDDVEDGVELLQGRNPNGGVLTDTNNTLNLRVFTPLK